MGLYFLEEKYIVAKSIQWSSAYSFYIKFAYQYIADLQLE